MADSSKAGRSKSPLVMGAIVVLVIVQAVLHSQLVYPRWRRDYNPVKDNGQLVTGGLSPDQYIFALAGFRELIAGILWVKADSFFDTGNYDAILPLIRLVTFLDPKQIDVYATGMWHIAYNFTDEEQRSDRRYIPSALALGKEGCRQNPDTYEMFFETAWIWYHKIDDTYSKAVDYLRQANERKDIMPARRNLLAMALQRDGQVEAALEHYYKLLDDAQARLEDDPRMYSNRQNRDTLEGNIDTTIVRMVQRGYLAAKDGRPTTGQGYDTDPPFDVGFSAKVSVVEPRVLRIEGTWNVLPIGTRIRAVLKDADYPDAIPAGLNWDSSNDVYLDPPKDRTFMQEQLFVKNRRFDKKVDMSRDPTMYPFTSKRYIMEFYYNPRSAPPHIQDKFGWNGEGLTDKNFLSTDARPGMRVFYTTLELTRDQLMRTGEWFDKTPVIRTKNFVDVIRGYNKDEITLEVPSLRAKN